jgi:hypothetical protein
MMHWPILAMMATNGGHMLSPRGTTSEIAMARSHSSPSGHPTERVLGHCPAIRALRTEIRHLVAFDAFGIAAPFG